MSEANNHAVLITSSRNVLVDIEGIDMEIEAWELLRLFYDSERIHFNCAAMDGAPAGNGDSAENPEGKSSTDYLYIKVSENDELWNCRVCLYTGISLPFDSKSDPDYFSEKTVCHSELKKPGGKLFERRKILDGSCVARIMAEYTGKRLPYGSLLGVRPVKLAMQCVNDNMDREETIRRLNVLSGINPEKAELLYNIAMVEKPFLREDEKAVHLYIGIPFCASRCLYCSFTAYPIKRYRDLVASYTEALIREAEHAAGWISRNGCHIGSVYVGGGTPTSIDAESLYKILRALVSSFDLDGCEFTVEAGRPDTITEDKLQAMLENNVTRISINPQTMNEETLKLIGRNHTPRDIEDKFYMARRLGFDNINMDIIAGLPGEDLSMFRKTLDKIEDMQPESLSVHTLAFKRASRLREENFRFSPVPDNIVEDMINEARGSAAKIGMRPYYLYRQKNILANLENTGYCRPGYECIYNIHTMEEVQTLIALGAGAVSKFVYPEENRIERVFNPKDVGLYISRIDEVMERKEVHFNR